MWNNGQQQGTWWPYNFQYQANMEDGDRSQEWAVKAAMWAQQRKMQEHMQAQMPQPAPPSGPTQSPENPPLPQDNAPSQPPPPDSDVSKPQAPDAEQSSVPFVHKERLMKIEGSESDSGTSSPWKNQQDGRLPHGPRKGQWKPVGEDESGAFDENQHSQESYYGDEEQNYNESSHPQEEYWDHNQHWDQSEHLAFPPHHDMNFQHQVMNFGPMHPHMMQQFYQHAVHPDAGPTMSIPEQVLASQIPEMNMAEMNKRKGLPQWLKDALDKKEKEKKKKLDKEKGKKTKGDEDDTTGNSSLATVATPTKKPLKETTSKVMHEKAPTKDGYSSDDEQENGQSEDEDGAIEEEKSAEEKAYEQMQKMKYWLMETLVTVTDEEIHESLRNCFVVQVVWLHCKLVLHWNTTQAVATKVITNLMNRINTVDG